MASHIPVMSREVISILSDGNPQGIYLDATFGCGGHAASLLAEWPQSRIIALDRDPEAQTQDPRITLYHARFSTIDNLCQRLGLGGAFQGILLDLGVSSPQLDNPERGFSFQQDGPLSMQMGLTHRSAADVVNTWSAQDMADLFSNYGEEPYAKRIAQAIVKERRLHPFTSTLQLAKLCQHCRPRGRHHSATQVFQALRLWVNQELDELITALPLCGPLLAPGGRLGVITFHSLEDRVCKRFFKQSTPFPYSSSHRIKPSSHEILTNPRSRSATLRWAQRSLLA